jgi:hypothetical protein
MRVAKGTLSLFVQKSTVPILFSAVKHLEPILDKPKDKADVAGLLGKIALAMVSDADSPYDSLLTLTGKEAEDLDFSLHVTMSDAALAKKYGAMADQPVGKVMLSSLADKIPIMAEVLRSLNTAIHLAMLEERVSAAEERLGITHEAPNGEQPSAKGEEPQQIELPSVEPDATD